MISTGKNTRGTMNSAAGRTRKLASERLQIFDQGAPILVRLDARPEIVAHIPTSGPPRIEPVAVPSKATNELGLPQYGTRGVDVERLSDSNPIERARRHDFEDRRPFRHRTEQVIERWH